MKAVDGIFCGSRVAGEEAESKFNEHSPAGFDYAEVSVDRAGRVKGVVYMAVVSAHFYVEFENIEQGIRVLHSVIENRKVQA